MENQSILPLASDDDMERVSFRQKLKDQFISACDKKLPISGKINEEGGVWMESPNKGQEIASKLEALTYKIFQSKKFEVHYSKMELRESIEFPDILFHVPSLIDLIEDETITKEIESYLGKKYFIDYCCLTIANFSEANLIHERNRSGEPHHDSVGHRLKLFIPVGKFGLSKNPSNYLKETHGTKWKTYLNDRKINKNNREIAACLDSAEQISVCSKSGQCVLFDTNGVHWGDYTYTNSPRMMVQVEFTSAGLKRRLLPGQLGQSTIEMTPAIYANFRHRFSGYSREAEDLEKTKVIVEGKKSRRYFKYRVSEFL